MFDKIKHRLKEQANKRNLKGEAFDRYVFDTLALIKSRKNNKSLRKEGFR